MRKNLRLGDRFAPYAYIAPIVVLSGLVLYFSILFTLRMSLSRWNGLDANVEFVGLQNFGDLFTDRILGAALANNLVFMIFSVGVQAALGLLLAILLRGKTKSAPVFRNMLFIPVIMAPVIIAAIFRIILDANLGALNIGLRAIGLGGLALPWLGDPRYSLASVILVNIFEWTGFSMIQYQAGLLSIPDEIYESALIDGSSFWRTLGKITLPMLRGTTTTLVVLGIIGSLKTFDLVYMLTGGGPGVSSEVLTTLLYKRTFEEFKSGSAAAIGVLVLVLAMGLSVLQIKAYDRDRSAMS